MLRLASRLLALLLALCAAAFAQRESDSSLPGSSFEISGQVRAADGQKAATNVLVRLEKFGGGLVDQLATDGTGRFRFSRLAPGQYIVSARTDGFSARTQQVDISRLIPRQYVILQLQPEESPFSSRTKAGVIDSRVPEKAQKEFDKGRLALRNNKPEEAIHHLENAARLAPDFFDAHMTLANAHMQMRHWEEAERALRRALEIRPKSSAALITLGEVYRRQKQYAEAEKTLVEGLKLDRSSWQGHFTLGRVYWEINEVLKAAPHIGETLRHKPDFAEGRLLAGNIFVRLGMRENALAEYEEYLRLAPDGEFATLTRENVQKLKRALADKKK